VQVGATEISNGGPMFRIYSIRRQTRVSSISNRQLAVPPMAYISTMISYLAGVACFIQRARLRPHSIRFNCFYHMAICPCFFFGVSTVLTAFVSSPTPMRLQAASEFCNASTASPALPCAWHGCRVLRGLASHRFHNHF
jgi:hypothetical protein